MGIHVPSNVPMKSTSFKGMKFEADEIAYDFYNEYGRKVGFSIRKEYVNKCKKTGVVTSRRFVCVKEGVRGKDKRDQNVKNPRAETRCGCEAHLVIVLNRDSKKYVVSEFIAEHNHYLHLPSTVHMMPSQGKVAATHVIEIDLAHELELRLKKSYELLSKQANARMIIDYSHFGDVITFDTTYSTNRDARPLGVFLGLNHYRETVVFGGALLYDETIESFVWLFETFLEAMFEKKLITIFTDQDAAMSAEKWAQAYVKKNFTAGMKTTQLSESFNADLKDCLCTDLNIVEFFTHLETVVSQKRDKELEAEYNSRQKFPRLKLKSSPMLNQVATMYMPKLFDLFQIKVEESTSTSSTSYQGGSSASVALVSYLESISNVVGSNDKINSARGLLTQGSVASEGPLTQESFTSGWNEMVHKVKPFF
nr:protein FAR1-RELATED SEQUENCE 5-like [Quercus suber]